MQKRLKLILLALIFAFSLTNVTYADELKDKNKKLKNVKTNIDDLKKKISDVKVQKSVVVDAIDRIEAQIGRVSADINKLDGQISLTKSNIKATSVKLNAAVNDFKAHQELFFQRVRSMYMNGSSEYINILMESESFSDFISRSDILKKVVAFDKSILIDMKKRQENISREKQKLESQQKYLIGLENETVTKKCELDDANAEKKKYYANLKEQQISLEKSLNEEEKESRKLETQIRSILAKTSKVKYSGERVGIVRAADIGHVPKITSPFGNRYHPILHKYKMHTGIDIGVPMGTPVYSMSDGEVIISEYLSGYGNLVAVDHGGGVTSLYAHNSKLLVHEGEKVKKGQMISKSGSTGYSTGPHLHFEVRINGKPVNPGSYLIIGH